MPAPSPLKKTTDAVVRTLKDEATYYREFHDHDAKIQKAKDAEDDELENKESVIAQEVRNTPTSPYTFCAALSTANTRQIRAKEDTRETYRTYFVEGGRWSISAALEKLRDELEKAGEKEADEKTEQEMKVAKEVVEKAEALIEAGPKIPAAVDKK